MRYNGMICVHCKNRFVEGDDVVVCPKCGTPHHRACWKELDHCANLEFHSDEFEWTPTEDEVQYEFRHKKAANSNNTDKGKIISCPFCTAINNSNDEVCAKCKRPLAPVNSNGFKEIRDTDIYSYHREHKEDIPNLLVDGIPTVEFADYIGEKKAMTYIKKFLGMDVNNRKMSVSVCAFLFGPIWFLYRKMFKEGLIFLLIFLLLTCIQTWCSNTDAAKMLYEDLSELYTEYFESDSMTQKEFEEKLAELEENYSASPSSLDKVKSVISTITEIANIILVLGASFFGDYLYRRKIVREIQKIRLECTDMETYRMTLRERGGVSAGGAVLGILAIFLISLISIIPMYTYLFNSLF